MLNVCFAEKGLDHVAEKILSYLDARSLREAELVCKEWHRVIADGLLWKKLIERKVRTDPLWRGLSERKGWWVFFLLLDLKHIKYCKVLVHKSMKVQWVYMILSQAL